MAAIDTPAPGPAAREESLRRLVVAHRRCRRCVGAGLLPEARPVFSGRPGQRVLLVGQAPGPVEVDVERPFAGRAGRQLMRWLTRAGFADADDVRARVWMTSTTTCFPGRRSDGSGDRRPSPAEVALCASWLDQVLALLRPRLVIAVGGLALERLMGRPMRLDDAVGRVLTVDGRDSALPPSDARVVVPLPHPSGQSRWLNDPARVARLEVGLGHVAALLPWAAAAGAGAADDRVGGGW